MGNWDRRINNRAFNVFSNFVVIIGMLLLIGGLCILVIGLLRQ